MSGGAEEEKEFQAADVRRAAMNLLARREYARRELAARLAARGMPGKMIDQTLDALGRENLQSDDRFAEAFVNARAGRGHGPVRIRIELEQKGVDGETIERVLADAEVDWQALAMDVRRKRFGPSPPGSFKERARQARFLQYRGFASDHVGRALAGED